MVTDLTYWSVDGAAEWSTYLGVHDVGESARRFGGWEIWCGGWRREPALCSALRAGDRGVTGYAYEHFLRVQRRHGAPVKPKPPGLRDCLRRSHSLLSADVRILRVTLRARTQQIGG
jgi:hypothetical protein